MSKRKGAGASNRMTREQLMGSLRQEPVTEPVPASPPAPEPRQSNELTRDAP